MIVGDDEVRGSLRAIRAALADGGRFAFETRHPLARAWEGWNTAFEARNPMATWCGSATSCTT